MGTAAAVSLFHRFCLTPTFCPADTSLKFTCGGVSNSTRFVSPDAVARTSRWLSIEIRRDPMKHCVRRQMPFVPPRSAEYSRTTSRPKFSATAFWNAFLLAMHVDADCGERCQVVEGMLGSVVGPDDSRLVEAIKTHHRAALKGRHLPPPPAVLSSCRKHRACGCARA
jgi:hypothetical protein